MKHFFKIFIVFFIAFTMVFGTGLYLIIAKENKKGTVLEESKGTIDPPGEDEENGEKVNVLLLGVDNLDKEEGGSRTDTMMILSLDSKNKKASILSIPRDTRVKIRGRKGYDKINSAHHYGGVDLSIKTVKDLLGIPIHHYVKVDYQALFKTVDDVGGVEVNVPFHMKYDDPYAKPPLHIDLKAGTQELDGKKSMQFLRFRKTNKRGYKDYPNQDLGRIQAQQQFINALAKKVLSPSSIFRVPKYIDTIEEYVDTDMSNKDMVSLALSASKVDLKHMDKEVVPGEPKMLNGVSYYEYDVDGLDELVGRLYYGNGESSYSDGDVDTDTDTDTDKYTDSENRRKKHPKIAVLNGSGKSGIATRVSDMLRKEGLRPDVVENADDFDQPKTIIYYNGNKDEAEKIKDTIGRGQLVSDKQKLESEKVDIIVLIGKDI